jgi:hypothetical protein
MSRVSKGIFGLSSQCSQILFDYIDLCFFDIKTYKMSLFDCMNCCKNNSEYVMPFSTKDLFFRDKLTMWVYEMSMSYIRQSGIDCNKIRLYTIECIRTTDRVLIENSKDVTVIYHFSDKHNGYVTTHKDKLNFMGDDNKYIVAVFERI